VNLHEYQAKEIFARYGIPVPKGEVASDPARVREIAARLGFPVVIKAQVHAGGRGKAGGVRLAKSADEAESLARAILALTIKGLPVRKVLVGEGVPIEKEYYLGVTLDRARKAPVVMASAAGGIDIEEVARDTPEKILRSPIGRRGELRSYQAREVAFGIESRPGPALRMAAILEQLARLYWETDASLAEINPLATTPDGKVLAVDAKLVIDDNALFRQKELESLREDDRPEEALARDKGLSYVPLDGDLGCVVNGAGLAMATMDLVQHFGGAPANFLDIGGSSNPEKVTAAMDILGRDARVRAILFNIFGGITRCDDVARGIVAAFAGKPPAVPVVVRLTGTNEEEARVILRGAPGVIPAAGMEEGVRKAIAAARGEGAR
jgi:succinyl-CoA synthetase beta subunit